jgi:hypothetical protein
MILDTGIYLLTFYDAAIIAGHWDSLLQLKNDPKPDDAVFLA